MERVLMQVDKRPMSGNREAMDKQKNILESRTDLTFDTSDITQEMAFIGLAEQLPKKALTGEGAA
jgi:hypothetical protein